jgi:alkylation response protein AidB-like acyl-CoA dehydrogenase
MDFDLSPEQQMIMRTVGEIARRYDRKYWLSHARAGTFPEELWQELGSAGLLGLSIPEAYGGAGLGLLETILVMEEMGHHGIPLLLMVVSTVVATCAIVRHASEEQKRRYLPAMASGKERFCFAITEPDAGTNTFRITTLARKDGDDWLLKGQKTFISGADAADHMLVVARTTPFDEVADKRMGISLFLLDADAPGIEKQKIPIGMVNCEKQYTIFFDDCRVPRDAMMGEEGMGVRYLFDGLNPERCSGAATSVGIGRLVLERAVAYANQRKVFGVPIGSHQGLAHPLAEVKAELEVAGLMNHKAAWLFDQGRDAGAEANMAKLLAAEASIRACDLAMEVHGGNGFSEDYDLVTLWPLVRLNRTAPISREMILNFIGQHVMGLPRSY